MERDLGTGTRVGGLKEGKEEVELEGLVLAGRAFLTCLPKKPGV